MKSRKNRAVTAFLTIAMLFVFTAAPVPVFAAPREIMDARSGVVRIWGEEALGGGWYSVSTGTGFIVGTEEDWYIVTNAHVVDAKTQEGEASKPLEEIYVMYETHSKLRARLVAFDPGRDIAILKVSENIPGKMVLTLNPNRAAGDEVYTSGYPDDGTGGLENDTLYTGADHQTVTSGTILSVGEFSGSSSMPEFGTTVIRVTVPIYSGNSGGPLFAADGTVIGVVRSSSSTLEPGDPAYRASAVEGSELMLLLDEYSIRYYAVPPEEPEEKPNSTYIDGDGSSANYFPPPESGNYTAPNDFGNGNGLDMGQMAANIIWFIVVFACIGVGIIIYAARRSRGRVSAQQQYPQQRSSQQIGRASCRERV